MSNPLSRAILLLIVTMSWGAPCALAQDPMLEEIVVTAQQRVESLQDVPVSVSALSGEKLMEAGIEKIEDLALYVPNFSMSETGIGTNVYLRGIGSGINNGFEQSVGMFIDGIYYGRAQLTRAPFLDLERVEVLRGPQSILFGKNSVAGAVSLITAKPGDEFEASVTALYEPEYDERELSFVISGPLTDAIGGRIAAQYREIDGYIENITLSRDEPQREELFLRGTLLFQPSDAWDATLKIERGTFDVVGRQIEIASDEPVSGAPVVAGLLKTLPAFVGQSYGQIISGFPGVSPTVLDNQIDFRRSASGPEFSDNTTNNVTITANFYFGEHTLTSTTGYLDYDFSEVCDCDFTGANIFTVPAEEEFEQISQELRFVSPLGGTFDYILGAFFQKNEVDFNEAFRIDETTILDDIVALTPFAGGAAAFSSFTVPRVYTQDTDTWSVFAQVTANIFDDRLRLTFGGRYSDDDKDGARSLEFRELDGSALDPVKKGSLDFLIPALFRAEEHSLSGSRSETFFSPLFNIQWDFWDEGMAYYTWTKGNKSGGFDARSNASDGPPLNPVLITVVPRGAFEFAEEEANSHELGLKTSLFDGRAEMNLALFRTEYDDLQVSIFDGTLGFNVGNAASAVSQGVEVDGRVFITEGLELSYSVAYVDFEFDDFERGQCAFGEIPTAFVSNTTGELLPIAPGTPTPLTSLGQAPVCDYDGRTNQYVAEWSGLLSADWWRPITQNLALHGVLDVIYSDDYFTSQNLDPASVQDAYWKLNARLGIGAEDGRWEVALVGKNLTDETIVSYSNDTPLAVGSFDSRGRYAFLQAPRTIAITATYRFQ